MASKGKLIQALYRALPSSHLVADLDLEKPDAVYFSWCGHAFKVGTNGSVEEARATDGFLRSTPTAELLATLLRREMKG